MPWPRRYSLSLQKLQDKASRFRIWIAIASAFMVFLASVLLLLADTRRDESIPSKATRRFATQMQSDLLTLIESKNTEEAVPKFVECLKGLARKQGWEQELITCPNLSRWMYCDDAWAAKIQTKQSDLVVILLKSWDGIPGFDLQTAILLDNQGRFLDNLSCEISSRLTRQVEGVLHTVIPSKPEADDARLIIRLDGEESARGNFCHQIYHGTEKLTIEWGDDKLPKNQPSQLDVRGLCRITIKDKKFHILSPSKDQGKRDGP